MERADILVGALCQVAGSLEEHEVFHWIIFEEARNLVSFSGQRRSLLKIEAEFVHRTASTHRGIPIPD